MTATHIFILQSHGGEWEDAFTNLEKASFNEAELQAIADQKNADVATFIANREKYDVEIAKWRTANPHPNPPDAIIGLKEIPRWISYSGIKQVITDEMRAQRAEIEEENARIREHQMAPYNARYEAWDALYVAETQRLTEEFNLPKNHQGRTTLNWDVTSVPFVE